MTDAQLNEWLNLMQAIAVPVFGLLGGVILLFMAVMMFMHVMNIYGTMRAIEDYREANGL